MLKRHIWLNLPPEMFSKSSQKSPFLDSFCRSFEAVGCIATNRTNKTNPSHRVKIHDHKNHQGRSIMKKSVPPKNLGPFHWGNEPNHLKQPSNFQGIWGYVFRAVFPLWNKTFLVTLSLVTLGPGDLSMRCAIDQCCLSLRSAVELKKRCFQDRCFCLFPREARCWN